MNMGKMTLEEKLEYYQRQTHQLKKRRDDANDKIEYLNSYIKELHQEINNLKSEKRFKQVVDGVKDTRTGRTLTHPLDFTLKLNELNTLYDYVFDRNEELEKKNEQLKQQLSDINGQLVMLDNCDNWDYDRMKHTVREIAEIIGYNGTIKP